MTRMSEKIIMIVVSLVCGQLVICGAFPPPLYIYIYIDTRIFGQKHIFPTSVPWHKLSYMAWGCKLVTPQVLRRSHGTWAGHLLS